LKYSYGNLKVINNLNGEFFPNEIFCILGNNGAGKTTLLNIISGIIRSDEGIINHKNSSLIGEGRYPNYRTPICQHEDKLFDYLTVLEHLELFQNLKLGKINHDEINNILKELDLIDKENYPCRDLSYGEKKN